jgi:hypothetical protein
MNTRRRAVWLLLFAVFGINGCSKRPVAPVGIVEDPGTHLPEENDIGIADWLNQSRPEIEHRFDDFNATAVKLLDVARGDARTMQLLPKLRPVLALPVFENAKFSARAGISLPPWAEEGKKDSLLALHLARFGDTDGAQAMVDPADAATRKEIESLRTGRNYPVEWTRCVAMAQFVNELRLASGDVHSATALIQIHQQLRIVLNEKAAAGPLGAVLLGNGKRALAAVGAAWEEKRKTGLAGDVQAALGNWGEVSPLVPALVPGASHEAVEKLFASGKGHAITVLGGSAARTFDLLALPLPGEEMEGLTAFLDAQGNLAGVAVIYRPRAGQTYPEPAYLGQRLAGAGVPGEDQAAAKGVLREKFVSGPLGYDITLVPRGSSIGGLVQVVDAKGAAAPTFMPPDPRDFGAVHFDRTFDQDRVALAPEQRSADIVTVTKAAEVRRVAPPSPAAGHALTLPPASSVQLRRVEQYDLLGSVSIRWDRGQNASALTRLAVPCWAAYGAPRFEPVFDQTGGNLSLVWEDATMRYALRLPHDDDQAPEFFAEDRRGGEGAVDRQKVAQTFDSDQRSARLAAGKPLQRLPRAFEEASAVKLGTARSDIEALLPASQSLRKTEIEGGWSVIFLKPPGSNSAVTPAQLLVRFGPGDKVAEIRLRYLERFVPKGDTTPTLLGHLSTACGAPEIAAAPWAGLWSDLPAQKPSPALYRWKDDTTIMTLQRDSGGAELTLRDAPADRPNGTELPPLRFLSRGVEGCKLGDSRAPILERWKITEPTTTKDGGVVLPMPKSSPYAYIVAYFENDKVVRLLTFHKMRSGFQAAEVPQALQEAWGRDIDHLGCVRRQETPGASVLGGFGWHDDVTRARTFALDRDQGPQLHTEWREWSPGAPAKDVAAAK